MQDISSWSGFGEPSFIEARKLLSTLERGRDPPPFEVVKLLVKLIPTSNSRDAEGHLVGRSLFVVPSSVLVLHSVLQHEKKGLKC